jgi:hypothetical protein
VVVTAGRIEQRYGETEVIVVTAALAVGALDSAQFATKNSKRARQSLAAAGVWAVGCLLSLLSGHGIEVVTAVVIAFIAFGSVTLLLIHVKHSIATPRVWLSPVLSLVALAFAVATL